MNIISTDKTADFRFLNHPVDPIKLHSEELIEESSEIDLPYGKAYMHQWNFEGMRILHTKNAYNNHYTFENKNEGNVVGLEFNIRGRYEIKHFGQTYHVSNQQHNVIYSPEIHNTFKNFDLNTETFKIEFTPAFFLEIIKDSNDILKRFSEKMQKDQPVVLSPASGVIDVQLSHVINEIIHCRFTGGMQKIFMLSKSLEILVLQAESFAHTENPKNNFIKRKQDMDKLEFARKYLIEHVDMPPTLSELAKKAGMNEYKLKRGFKEAFNSTVFGYLSNFRLNTAKHRLESDTGSIAEIAYELGYSSPQHFSKAFKEKFGLPPKKVRK